MTIARPDYTLRRLTALLTTLALVGIAPLATAASDVDALRRDLAAAQAQNDIRSLMHAYGRTIDARDWDAFARLWTDDATYVGGPGSEQRIGGKAIAGFLREIIGANPSGVGEPNFHVFFNEEITVDGDRAKATSMSSFVTPGPTGAPQMAILARYDDEFVRAGGIWKFERRVVQGKLPVPRR